MSGNTRPIQDLVVDQINYIHSLQNDSLSGINSQMLDQAERIRQLTPADIASRENLIGAPVSYWLDLRDYHPESLAAELNLPILILQGGRDYQVTEKDFDIWKQALKGKERVEFRHFPECNHLLIPGKGKITPAEYQKAGSVSPEVIETLASWVKKQ